MEDKIKNFLMCIGAISLIALPLSLYHDHNHSKRIEEITAKYYDVKDEVLKMISKNEQVLLDLKANETHDYYSYDDFEIAFWNLDSEIEYTNTYNE